MQAERRRRRRRQWWRLKEVLQQCGVPQRQLARTLGMNEGQLSRIVHGARNPSWTTAIRIAVALNVSLDALAGTVRIAPRAEPEPLVTLNLEEE